MFTLIQLTIIVSYQFYMYISIIKFYQGKKGRYHTLWIIFHSNFFRSLFCYAQTIILLPHCYFLLLLNRSIFITLVNLLQQENASLDSRYFLSLLLEPNSLLVLKDDMYKTYLHGIAERTEDLITDKICNINHLGNKDLKLGDELKRTTRVSLTIRYVPKTLKVKLKLAK